MFSFRTTPLADQMDKALTQGRVVVVDTPSSFDPATGLTTARIFSQRGNLFRHFTPSGGEFAAGEPTLGIDYSVLKEADAVLVDIQDAGSRSFPLTKEVCALIEALAGMDYPPAMYLVDRPNPAGRTVEGTIPVIETEPHTPRVAHRHGLTLGELCHLLQSEIAPSLALHVISMRASSSMLLPWAIPPSKDYAGLFSPMLYSSGILWTRTSVSVALGTPRPYEYIGAPYLRHEDVRYLPCPEGVVLRPCSFVPGEGKFAGELCNGFQIMLSPGARYHSFLHAVLLMRSLRSRYSQFNFDSDFNALVCDPVVKAYLSEEITFDVVQEHVKAEEQKWIRKARRYCLYDDPPVRNK